MASISSLITNVKSWVSSALTKYLPLSGGTLSGVIQSTTSNPMRRSVDDSFMEFFGATTYKNGAFIRLDGKDGPKPGVFSLATGDGTSNKFLLGYPDGSLTWDGKPVVCVESWRSGYNWYRKYSDGFLEQGGTFGANTGGWTDATLTFPKAFSNTNYNLFVQGNWSDPTASSCWVHARNASSVTVRHANNYYSTMPSYFVAYGT